MKIVRDQKAVDQARAVLKPRPVPHGLEYLLGWFREAARGRTWGDNGANPLGWGGLTAWAEAMGRKPLPYEYWALLRMDLADLSADWDPKKKRARG